MPRERPLGPNPQDRPNWASLNEGQRRYAMEQWNLARVRRGKYFTPPGEGLTEQDAIDNFDLDLLGSPQDGDNESTSQEETGAIDEFLDDIRHQQDTRPNMQQMEVSSSQGSSGSKRGSSSQGGPPNKKAGTSLPGTGGNLDGMVPGGSGEAGPVAILRPIGMRSDRMEKVYHKKWRFLTSANANVILAEAAAGSKPARYALTTGLANIPWEYLFFYMSPAEYNRMKDYPGTYAKRCNVTVRAWNTRVAFQTGDTQTSNATLNQNKFLQVGKGLRNIPFICCDNRKYTFSTTEAMEPTGFASQTSIEYRDGLKTSMYGYDNDSTSFNTRPPADATGAEIYLQDYLTIYTLKGDAHGMKPGFPPLKNFIEEYDASACVNATVIAQDYEFAYAPLVPNFAAVPQSAMTGSQSKSLTIGTMNEISGIKAVDTSHANLPTQSHNISRSYIQGHNKKDTYFSSDYPYLTSPIEQSGVFEEIARNSIVPREQPSLHIGIRAVPKLTTLDNTVQANSWLDAQGYFEVDCTLVTESVDPFTYIKGGCYSSNTHTQLQYFTNASPSKPVAHTYDSPNEYGRMPTKTL